MMDTTRLTSMILRLCSSPSQLAAHAVENERLYQEVKFGGATCANRDIAFADKLNWITEEFLEVVTAHNDRKATREVMHEIVQLGALCKAAIESHVKDDPEFPEYVRSVRAADLERWERHRAHS